MRDEQVEGLKIFVAALLHRQRLVVLDARRAEQNGAGQKFQPQIAPKMQCPDKKNSRWNANMPPPIRGGGTVDGVLNHPGAKSFTVANGAE